MSQKINSTSKHDDDGVCVETISEKMKRIRWLRMSMLIMINWRKKTMMTRKLRMMLIKTIKIMTATGMQRRAIIKEFLIRIFL